jgi:predicted nucleic acid-binding protein
VVLDSMIFVYLSVDLPTRSDEARSVLAAAEDVIAPDSLFAEVTESLRKWVLAGRLAPSDALAAAEEARSIVDLVVETPTVAARALGLALEREHAVYDTLFVAVAERYSTRVVTYDRELLRKFPEWTVSVPDFLARRG